jgi:hypothetical protein
MQELYASAVRHHRRRYKGSTGFLIIRNPKRYFFQLTPLVMTSYIVAAETNDIRLLLANQNQIMMMLLRRDIPNFRIGILNKSINTK